MENNGKTDIISLYSEVVYEKNSCIALCLSDPRRLLFKNPYEKELDPKNPITLTLWHYYNGIQKTALDNMIEEFNNTVGSEKGIVVEANNVGSILELTDKVKEAAAGKVGASEMPEIFTAYADTAYELNADGYVADLSQYLSADEISEYVDGYVQEGMFDNELKIFPAAKATECLQINKTDWDKFADAADVSLDDLKTVEGLNEAAENIMHTLTRLRLI